MKNKLKNIFKFLLLGEISYSFIDENGRAHRVRRYFILNPIIYITHLLFILFYAGYGMASGIAEGFSDIYTEILKFNKLYKRVKNDKRCKILKE